MHKQEAGFALPGLVTRPNLVIDELDAAYGAAAAILLAKSILSMPLCSMEYPLYASAGGCTLRYLQLDSKASATLSAAFDYYIR